MDKISIVIPIYNVGQYLRQCIDSVINQSYKNLEILCIDDGSVDNSRDIICEYDDNRIIVIQNETNQGAAISRNYGIERATGKYIFFLDSDDYLMPDILEKLYLNICNTDYDFVVSSNVAFTDDLNNPELVKKSDKSSLSYSNMTYRVTDQNFDEAFFKIPCMPWGKLFSTDFIRKNDLFFINKNVTFEDNGFHLKILSCKPKISFIRDIGVMYRIRESSMTFSMDKQENRKEKFSHLKKVLDNGFEYINQKLSTDEAKKIYLIIKNLEVFPEYFKSKLDLFYNIKLSRFNKRIEILKLPVYREKIRGNTKLIRLFGIPLAYINLKNSGI